MFNWAIYLTLMSALTLGVVILYHRRIREAGERYQNAKSVLEDIMISFSRQLRKHDREVETSAMRIDSLVRQSRFLAEGIGAQGRKLQTLTAKVGEPPHLENTRGVIAALEDRVKGFEEALEVISQKVSAIETLQQSERVAEPRIESAIPIKRERALESLTETELSVLELLSLEGEKTSPEVKDRIRLSREHTARLMKKLYERGYIERNSRKIPFAYHLKEEMKHILKKPEQGNYRN